MKRWLYALFYAEHPFLTNAEQWKAGKQSASKKLIFIMRNKENNKLKDNIKYI